MELERGKCCLSFFTPSAFMLISQPIKYALFSTVRKAKSDSFICSSHRAGERKSHNLSPRLAANFLDQISVRRSEGERERELQRVRKGGGWEAEIGCWFVRFCEKQEESICKKFARVIMRAMSRLRCRIEIHERKYQVSKAVNKIYWHSKLFHIRPFFCLSASV